MAKDRLAQIEVHWTKTVEGVTTLELRVPESVLDNVNALNEWVENNVTDSILEGSADDLSEALELDEVHEVS